MESILFNVDGGVATITLNRPDVLNSFNKEMALAMQQALKTYEADASLRCLVITGSGRAFCAGQDLAEVVAQDGPALEAIVREHYNPIVLLIRNIPKPIVAMVNGVAAGAGANIALACDIVIAAESSSFIQAFSKIGLIPDSGGTFTLPRLIGLQRATALMFLGDKISASAAQEMGMIYQVVADDQLLTATYQIAEKLASMPTKGLGFTKQALNASLTNTLYEQLDLEGDLQTAASKTYDYNEGVDAFLAKRKPVFKGE